MVAAIIPQQSVKISVRHIYIHIRYIHRRTHHAIASCNNQSMNDEVAGTNRAKSRKDTSTERENKIFVFKYPSYAVLTSMGSLKDRHTMTFLGDTSLTTCPQQRQESTSEGRGCKSRTDLGSSYSHNRIWETCWSGYYYGMQSESIMKQ
jgi:hypothetical protein